MSWEDDTIKITRVLIDDLCETEYADDKLKQVLVTSAYIINSTVSFNETYTVSLSAETITPDPSAIPDPIFISLTSLKAACIILGGEAKVAAMSAISVTDGPSSINMKGKYDALKERQEAYCDKLEKAIMQYQLGNAIGCQAILGPVTLEHGYTNPLNIR